MAEIHGSDYAFCLREVTDNRKEAHKALIYLGLWSAAAVPAMRYSGGRGAEAWIFYKQVHELEELAAKNSNSSISVEQQKLAKASYDVAVSSAVHSVYFGLLVTLPIAFLFKRSLNFFAKAKAAHRKLKEMDAETLEKIVK